LTKATCAKIYPLISVLTMCGLAASEMLLTLRTWAVWNRNKRLTIILSILFVLVWGAAFVILVIYLKSVTFVDPPFPGFEGCILAHSNIAFFYLWFHIITWDTLTLVLILVPAVRAYRYGGNSALMTSVYREGIVYYIYLFVLSFVNIILGITLPMQYQHLLATVERMIHSMLSSRVLLQIRAQAGHLSDRSN